MQVRSTTSRKPPFPFVLETGQRASFTLDIAPPANGWQTAGRCRIQSTGPLEGRTLELNLNGQPLAPSADVSAPHGNPYPGPLDGNPDDYRAWTGPPELLNDGLNQFEIRLVKGSPAELFYFDLAIL